jgi:predicted aspartyl protease
MKHFVTKPFAAPLVTTALFLLVVTTGCPSALADDKPIQRQSSTFSYTTFDVELPLVQVRMNNKLTGTFLLDTGANTSVVTDKVANKLGLTPQARYKDGKPYTVGGQAVKGITLTPMQIGPVNLAQVAVSVVPERSLSLFSTPLDGIIGTNILSVFSVFFDFPRHQITLWYPAGLSAEEINNAGFDHASVLSMTSPLDTGDYLVPVQLRQGGRSVQEGLLLDTGGGVTVISKKSARQLGLDPASHTTQPSFRGSFVADRARLTALRLGDIEVEDKLVEYPSDDKSLFPSILGMDTLSGYRVLLDFPSKKMYIQAVVPSLNIKPSGAKTAAP